MTSGRVKSADADVVADAFSIPTDGPEAVAGRKDSCCVSQREKETEREIEVRE